MNSQAKINPFSIVASNPKRATTQFVIRNHANAQASSSNEAALQPDVRDVLDHLNVAQAMQPLRCDVDARHSIRQGEFHLEVKGSADQHQHICKLCMDIVFEEAEVKLATLKYAMLRQFI